MKKIILILQKEKNVFGVVKYCQKEEEDIARISVDGNVDTVIGVNII